MWRSSDPLPAWLFAAVLLAAHLVLTRTPFGRQVFAIGHDLEMARKAGIRTGRILASVYLISGFCAALAAMVSLSQLGSVSPKFGEGKEFAAIAAAVLGGTTAVKITPPVIIGINSNPSVLPFFPTLLLSPPVSAFWLLRFVSGISLASSTC